MVAPGDDNVIYGDQYGQTHNLIPLKSVEVSYTRTDHERTMANPIVKSIHQSAELFWGHPVSQFATDAILFDITGGAETISSHGIFRRKCIKKDCFRTSTSYHCRQGGRDMFHGAKVHHFLISSK